MAKNVRTVLIVLLTLSMTSCRWLGCRWLGCRKKPEYSKPLPPGQMALRKLTDPKDYPDFGSGFRNRDGLVEAINHSLEYYAKPSSQEFFPYLDISHARAVNTLEAFKAVLNNAKDSADLHRIICERFDVYISIGCDDKGTVLFTGYCTPIYKGSLKPTADFRYPLYKLPADLVKKPDGTPVGRRTPGGEIVPYYTRGEIETKQILAGKKLELVWLGDPLEAFIVHVQGSARIELTDGSELCVGYHGKTDRPYTSMGLSLVADKKIHADDLSLQAIIEYFKKYPHELKSYMYKNACYVFFIKGEGGPFGSLNCPVIPYRSVATDKAVFPRGLITYAVTKVPKMQTRDKVTLEPFYSFALDQDTGGAIRSAGRCDIYMGIGPDALLLAGRTRAEGKLYYLAVKESGTGQ
jgi:membrane-bound lytic murein transglycosylase A